jgi:hypothetical protein
MGVLGCEYIGCEGVHDSSVLTGVGSVQIQQWRCEQSHEEEAHHEAWYVIHGS